MDEGTIAMVRTSWGKVEAMAPTAAALFYEKLFDADPSLRPLFKGDMQAQGLRLMQMIGAAIARLDDLPGLRPVLRDLGQRHAGYGVREPHYRTVGAALIGTLEVRLGDGFTPSVRDAWLQVYAELSRVMIEAAPDRRDVG